MTVQECSQESDVLGMNLVMLSLTRWGNLGFHLTSLGFCFSPTWTGSYLFFPYWFIVHLSSVSFSVVSDSLQPNGLQHARPPCPSPTPGACSNSCLSSWWCHPTISSSIVPFSSCLQSFPASGLFQWVSSLHQVAKVLEFQLQHQSFKWMFRTDFL